MGSIVTAMTWVAAVARVPSLTRKLSHVVGVAKTILYININVIFFKTHPELTIIPKVETVGSFHLIELRLLQVKELNHYLEAEKSCRTDLEMYVAVLNTQKSVLQEDAEKLRKELHEGKYIFCIFLISVSKRTSK